VKLDPREAEIIRACQQGVVWAGGSTGSFCRKRDRCYAERRCHFVARAERHLERVWALPVAGRIVWSRDFDNDAIVEVAKVEKHPPAYLSASRLTCYTYCPAEFYKRYILKRDEPPTPERLFGTAVHKGLEAHYNGGDSELAFLRAWREAKAELQAADQAFGTGLPERGLELLEMVRGLGLQGTPESWLSVVHPSIPLPFIGYADLWSEGHIYDFKTAGYGWTQSKADEQIFQPAIYSQAHADAFGSIPEFTFIVMPRISGRVQVLDGTRTGEQIEAAFARAREIYDLIEAQEWGCRCGKHQQQAA
jgi:hypothetical protein